MSEVIIFDQYAHHAVITLNRPKVLNALNQEMVDQLVQVIDKLSQCKQTRCVLLKANGKHFMAGGDVKLFATLTMSGEERHAELKPLMQDLHDCMQKLSTLPMPVIACVQGAVAGFGLGLVMAADLAVVSERAYFNLAYVRLGLCPDGLVSYWLPRKIGLTKSMELALTGASLTAQDAKAAGLINQVVAPDALTAEAERWAQQLIQSSQHAVRHTKKLLRASLDHNLDLQSALELESFGHCVAEEDFVEGVKAFLEKRAPKFDEMN